MSCSAETALRSYKGAQRALLLLAIFGAFLGIIELVGTLFLMPLFRPSVVVEPIAAVSFAAVMFALAGVCWIISFMLVPKMNSLEGIVAGIEDVRLEIIAETDRMNRSNLPS